jgi:hypothetical protein
MPVRKHAMALLIALAFAIAACSSTSNPIGPSNQPEVANNADNFQFQASNLAQTTQTLTYSWMITGTAANVNVSGVLTGGDATLILRDAAGTQTFSRSLTSTGTFTSAAGTTGTWQIEVRLSNATGTVNFRVQKSA